MSDKNEMKHSVEKIDQNLEESNEKSSNEAGMTLQGEDETKAELPPKKKGKIWKKVFIALGSVVFLSAVGVYIAGVSYFQDKFLPNSTVNGMDVSRMKVDNIEKVIGRRIKNYTISIRERGGKKEKITSNQIGYHYVSKGEVQLFKEEQNPYLWPVSFWKEYQYKFASSAAYDEQKFMDTINNLTCMQEKNVITPKDAYVQFGTTLYEVVEEVEGNQVDKDKLTKVLKSTIANHEKQISLEKAGCYAQPSIRSDNEGLTQMVDKLNQYCQTRIEYVFGSKREVLDGSAIRNWISYDESGNVKFDEEQARVYVAGLAEKYDTYNKARNFKTNDGSEVTVKGGSYGWMMDQEQEVLELVNLIKVGAAQERTAVFAQTAVSWDNSDLGDSYVEIDLGKQHLWMYKNGQVIVDSDFVSGSMVKEGCATPSGTYTLYYKKSPDVLKSDKPGDSYQTPVTYWMPFNGGVGMHDADWRGSFGGSIYVYGGSHGCINLPHDIARQIYENIYDGFPIICFYR